MILAFGVPVETENLSLINLHDIRYSFAILSYASVGSAAVVLKSFLVV